MLVIIFAIAFFRGYISPLKVRQVLGKRNEYLGNVVAALIGVITPFCSCSAVPLFIGFIESGVPLGVTFSFLISSPMVNEIAVILLWGLVGWQITLIYILSGLIISIISGIILKAKLEGEVESYVYEMINKVKAAEKAGIPLEEEEQTLKERVLAARDYTLDLLRKIILYVVIAIGIGAAIHGYAPADFLVSALVLTIRSPFP